jgi:AraC-like DNA-binding protein
MTHVSPARSVPTGASRHSALVAHGLFRALARLGVSREALCAGAGLDPAALADAESWITRAELHLLIAQALKLSGEPALGLRWAARLNDGDFVPLSYLVAQCSTMRQALGVYTHFVRLFSDAEELSLHEQEQTATIRCLATDSAPTELRPFIGAMTLGCLLYRLRSITPGAQLVRLTFAHPAPSFADEYERLFGLAPQFDREATTMVFARELLDAEAPDRDEALRVGLTAIAEQRLLRLTDSTPYARRVRDHLLGCTGETRTDVDAVAKALGLSERSLRRRLAEEGSTFFAVWTEARAATAIALLERTRLTLQEIAFELGFSGESSFHRAFKRWTGTSPGAYRKRT